MNETTPAAVAQAPAPSGEGAPRPAAGSGAARRLAGLLQRQGVLAVLLTVVIVASFVYPTFATLDNARGVTVQASFLAVVALGMTLVVISGGIDLSVGSVFALGGVLAAWASQWGLLPALLVPLAACGAIGLLNGFLIARAGMAPFIVTLATLLVARGMLLAFTDEGATTYLVPKGSAFAELGQGSVGGFGHPVLVALALFGAAWTAAPAHLVRPDPLRRGRQQRRGHPDGPARRPYEAPRLHAQRSASRTRRCAERGQAVLRRHHRRRGDGTRRDLRRRDRRHPARGRRRIGRRRPSGASCCWPPSRTSSTRSVR